MSGGRNGGEPSVERNRLLTLEGSLDVTGACADIADVKHSVALEMLPELAMVGHVVLVREE